MKDWISALVQIGPVLLVLWWLGRHNGQRGKLTVREVGLALLASGLCSLIGTLFFGLSVFGKDTVSDGEEAVGMALLIVVLGVGALCCHYLFFVLLPTLAGHLRNQRKPDRTKSPSPDQTPPV